jgi:dihydropteroate synthase
MESLPVDKGGIPIMMTKGEYFIFKAYKISSPAANILKQQMLSIGGECATTKGVITCSAKEAPVILMGTKKHYLHLIDSLENQCFGLDEIRRELIEFFSGDNNKREIKVGRRTFDFSKKTYIMGVVNVTPDSFSDGGKYLEKQKAIEAALEMIDEGADIIDIGGESTRPGSDSVDVNTELSRVIPVIEGIRKKSDTPLSIDTYKSQVAQAAISCGVNLVNDISGLRYDEEMANVVTEYNIPIVLMHIKGKPKNMQESPHYDNIIDEILLELSESVSRATAAGVNRDKIIVDPGIGFGKHWKDNYFILRYLNEFKSLGYPLLVGPSRKSFIGNLLHLPPDDRLEGTLAAVCCAVMNGADIIRVHDVKEAGRALRVTDAIIGKV